MTVHCRFPLLRDVLLLLIAFLVTHGNSFCPSQLTRTSHWRRCWLVVHDGSNQVRNCPRHIDIGVPGLTTSTSSLQGSSGGKYVPDGLTPEEYSQIKKREQEKMAKMDFGAFGPRFRKSAPPEGDWLLMRSLWTNGFASNNPSNRAGSFGGSGSRVGLMAQLWAKRIRVYGPYLMVSYTLVHLFHAAAMMLHASSSSHFPTIRSALGASFHFFFRLNGSLGYSVTWLRQVEFLKAALACILAVPIQWFVERINRRWLWSPKRTIATIIVAALGSLVLCGVLLVRLGL